MVLDITPLYLALIVTTPFFSAKWALCRPVFPKWGTAPHYSGLSVTTAGTVSFIFVLIATYTAHITFVATIQSLFSALRAFCTTHVPS